MDIEVKRMSPTAIEMLDQLSAVCKRFGVDYYAASQNQRAGTALFSPAAADVEMCCTRRCLFGSDGTEPVRDETRVL